MEHNRLTKVTIINPPRPPPPPKRKIPWPNLSKNYATLYFVIHLNDFFLKLSYCNGIHEVDTINISQFFKKIPFKDKWVICVQIGPKLQHLISHDLPYSKGFFETL